MYKSYLSTQLGILEITCDDSYLISIYIVEKIESANENNICKIVSKQLTEYFEHKRERFDVPINFSNSFADQVRKCLCESNYSKTISYKQLAQKLDSKAYQAVGTSMATNPYFIVVP